MIRAKREKPGINESSAAVSNSGVVLLELEDIVLFSGNQNHDQRGVGTPFILLSESKKAVLAQHS